MLRRRRATRTWWPRSTSRAAAARTGVRHYCYTGTLDFMRPSIELSWTLSNGPTFLASYANARTHHYAERARSADTPRPGFRSSVCMRPGTGVSWPTTLTACALFAGGDAVRNLCRARVVRAALQEPLDRTTSTHSRRLFMVKTHFIGALGDRPGAFRLCTGRDRCLAPVSTAVPVVVPAVVRRRWSGRRSRRRSRRRCRRRRRTAAWMSQTRGPMAPGSITALNWFWLTDRTHRGERFPPTPSTPL